MLPFSNNWSPLKKIVAVKYYISMLTGKLNTSKHHIVRDVLKNSRYLVLADKLREKADKAESIESFCKRQDHQKIEVTNLIFIQHERAQFKRNLSQLLMNKLNTLESCKRKYAT